MTITMTEGKIRAAGVFLHRLMQVENNLPDEIFDYSPEDYETIARRLQDFWQDSEEATIAAEADDDPDPGPASQAPLGGDLYGATISRSPPEDL